MARHTDWREGESRVISVTPVARGLVPPALTAAVVAAIIQFGALHWHPLHRFEALFLLVLVGPSLLVVATRSWRWRSHSVHLTDERVVMEGGVAHRTRSAVELRDIVAVHVEQSVRDRVSRRGTVFLDTTGGAVMVGRLRHPAAFCRLVDRERNRGPGDRVPLDTVFEYEDPTPRNYEVNPRRPPDLAG